ncbi:MAG: DUF421 domain-containing protein, partial [Clostridia bacterium]|nr:DUF421 domain-containing protein [Clostridia bacterium]
LIIAEVMMSYLSLKSKRMRKLLSGEASIIIYDGQIDERELARLRFNINDLLEELRLNSCHDVSDVQVAVIETSGKLSIIPKDSARTATTEDLALKNLRHDGLPCTIVSDGVLDKRELERSGKDIKWFESEMKKRSINRIKDIFIASLDAEGELFIQLKRRAMK